MRYWVLSPNIGMTRGRVLENWKETIREQQAVFMGWSSDPQKDGRRGFGQKFAREVELGDIILSAHRLNWEWIVVATGKVASEACRGLELGDGYHYGTYRRLTPFVPLESKPELNRLSLRGTSPDRLRQVGTIIELKPQENSADRRLCRRLRAVLRRAGNTPAEPPLDLADEEALDSLPKKSYEEGQRRLVLHRRLEGVRNRQLVRDAKKYFKKTHSGKLTCEVCGTSFEKEYGARGGDFIEAHHRIPIAKIKKKTKLRISDLAMVCANCHRMLHCHPWVSVEKLRREWEKLNRA